MLQIQRMKPYYIIALLFLALGCQEKPPLTPQEIVKNAIDNACNGHCDAATITFDFRDKTYSSYRNNGVFKLQRQFTDSVGTIRDVLTNQSFQRFVNDSLVTLPDSIARTYAASVNSVHYFVQLPYGLQAPAAQKKLLGDAVINNKHYYEIGVTFQEEGGGVDFEDEFVYWIDKENFQVDYIAYKYAVDGGGIRFRTAYNPRVVKGIRFVDYKNYKPESLTIPLTDLDQLFEKNKLKLLSTIATENVTVHLTQKE